VETLGEVDHEAREQAAQLGITQFEMSAGLNDSPTFIAALADLVATAIGAPQRSQSDRERLVAVDLAVGRASGEPVAKRGKD
jgi:hypothetical protein